MDVMSTSNRERLLAGDPEPVGPALAGVLSELLKRGYRVWDVHGPADGGLHEVLLDREIDTLTSEQVVLPRGVVTYEDYDEHDNQRGYGFLCQETGHCVNGPVSDGKGHS